MNSKATARCLELRRSQRGDGSVGGMARQSWVATAALPRDSRRRGEHNDEVYSERRLKSLVVQKNSAGSKSMDNKASFPYISRALAVSGLVMAGISQSRCTR